MERESVLVPTTLLPLLILGLPLRLGLVLLPLVCRGSCAGFGNTCLLLSRKLLPLGERTKPPPRVEVEGDDPREIRTHEESNCASHDEDLAAPVIGDNARHHRRESRVGRSDGRCLSALDGSNDPVQRVLVVTFIYSKGCMLGVDYPLEFVEGLVVQYLPGSDLLVEGLEVKVCLIVLVQRSPGWLPVELTWDLGLELLLKPGPPKNSAHVTD